MFTFTLVCTERYHFEMESTQMIDHNKIIIKVEDLYISCFDFPVNELRQSEFSRYTKLKHLRFANCPLEGRIHSAAFENTCLTNLKFINCKLSEIPTAVWSLKNTLQHLTLQDIDVVNNIANNAFEGFKVLSSVSLSKISKIPKALSNIKNSLLELDLSRNRMKIEREDFANLCHLKELYLPNVVVKSLPVGILDEVAKTLYALE